MNERTDNLKPEAERQFAPVRVLDARRAAIDKCVEECGGEMNKDGTEDPMRGVLVMLAKEAAGQGFDAGVRYMASNAKVSHSARPNETKL